MVPNELLIMTFPVSVIVFACTIATLTDIQGRVIPNWLCYSALLAGLAFHGCVMMLSIAPGNEGIRSIFPVGIQGGIGGSFTCALVLLPFWMVGSLGGGDVKFVAALGMIVGPILGLKIILLGCLFGILFVYIARAIRGLKPTKRVDDELEQVEDSKAELQSELPMAGFLSLATILVVIQAILNK